MKERRAIFLEVCRESDADLETRAFARFDASPLEEKRLRVYRRLVRQRIRMTVFQLLKGTKEALDREIEGGSERAFEAFMAEHGPRTPYLRDVVHEFEEWVRARGASFLGAAVTSAAAPTWPDWLAFEAASFAVLTAVDEPRQMSEGMPELDEPLAFSKAAALVHVKHAIYKNSNEARDASLLLYRDESLALVVRELDERDAQLLRALADGVTLRKAVELSAGVSPVPDAVLHHAARLLGGLTDLGVFVIRNRP